MVPSPVPSAEEAPPHARTAPPCSAPSPAVAAAAGTPPAAVPFSSSSPSPLPPTTPLPSLAARADTPSSAPAEGASRLAAVVALQTPQSAPILAVAAAGGPDSAKSPALPPSTGAPQPQGEPRSASGSRDNREKHGSTPPSARPDSDQRAMLLVAASPTGPRVGQERCSSSSCANSPPMSGGELVFSGAVSAALSAAAASAAAVPSSMRPAPDPSGSAASLGPSPPSGMANGVKVPLLGAKSSSGGGAAAGPAAAAAVTGPFAAAMASLQAAYRRHLILPHRVHNPPRLLLPVWMRALVLVAGPVWPSGLQQPASPTASSSTLPVWPRAAATNCR